MSNRLGLHRAALIAGIIALIAGTIYFVSVVIKSSPPTEVEHDHDGDGRPDHAPGAH